MSTKQNAPNIVFTIDETDIVMTKKFKKILTMLMAENIDFKIEYHEIAKQYYLNSTIGDKTLAWQLVDESENVPSQNAVWLYRHNSDYGVNYVNLKSYIESITQAIDTYKTS